jgi:hypothetical protein
MNKSETEPISTRPVVQLTMITKWQKVPIDEAIFLSENVPIGHIVDFTTHTSTDCMRYQVLMAAYYKAVNANTHLFFPSVSLSILDAYYILFSLLLFIFYSISFLPQPPPPTILPP